jgi:hypothetical protein
MKLSSWYWLIMLLLLVYGLWRHRAHWPVVGLVFLLLVVVGWAVFGSPIQ